MKKLFLFLSLFCLAATSEAQGSLTTKQVEHLWYPRQVPDTSGIDSTFNAMLNRNDSNKPKSFATITYVANHSGGGGGWSLTGNAGTNHTNFLGTTDTASLFFQVNSTYAGYVLYGDNSHFNVSYGIFNSQPWVGTNNSLFGDGVCNVNVSGSNITAIGVSACSANISGGINTAVGVDAMASNATGSCNTVIGAQAGASLNSSSWNTLGGDSTDYSNLQGFSNSYWGYASGAGGTSGHNNTAIGDSTYFNTNGSFNTCVGSGAECGTHQSNSTAIGAGAVCASNNQVVLGNTSVNSFVFNGDLEPGVGNYGTSGQLLASGGSGVAPAWINNTSLISGTHTAITSGSFTFPANSNTLLWTGAGGTTVIIVFPNTISQYGILTITMSSATSFTTPTFTPPAGTTLDWSPTALVGQTTYSWILFGSVWYKYN